MGFFIGDSEPIAVSYVLLLLFDAQKAIALVITEKLYDSVAEACIGKAIIKRGG